jgi:DNA-binding transcriptional LysR family regulator
LSNPWPAVRSLPRARLRKSQSTISTAIANLEADLGVTLFDRTSRQPTLTPQGEQVLSYVKAILAASDGWMSWPFRCLATPKRA